jgi:hypothetical protein
MTTLDDTELAQIDWRDLLMEADFARNIEAHEKWSKKGAK